jgi:hypothetical protein
MPIEHIKTNITVNFKVTELSSEKIATAIASAYPKDPTLTVVGLTIPLLAFTCKNEGIIDPISDIKNAVSRIYDYLQKGIMMPVWTILYKLYNILKKFGLGVLDLSLGILNLKVNDLLNPNICETIEKAVKNLYNTARSTLDSILRFLNIPTPAFEDIRSPEKEIEHFVKSILASLWSQFWKKVEEIRNLIKKGLRLWDLANYFIRNPSAPFPTEPIWDAAINAVLGKYLDLIKNPPTIEQILSQLKAFAQRIYRRAEVTAAEIMAVLKRFTLPILGFPLDWELPLNVRVYANSIDLAQIIADIKIWINNFVANLLQKFINAILKILSLFGLSISFPPIPITLTACAIRTY